MKKRLFLASASIFVIPVCFSLSACNEQTRSTPFAAIALAGHVIGSNTLCNCGLPDCVCSPGEMRVSSHFESGEPDIGGTDAQAVPVAADDFDPGVAAMILLLALMIGYRFRLA